MCEEKWKNLRTVFVRTNKSAPSGSARKSKKPYYLNEHLQFLLPYVKPSTDLTTSGNLLPTPDHDILLENNEQSDTEDQDEDLVQQEQYFSDKIISKNHEEVRSPEEQTKGTKKRKSELSQADQSFIDFVKMKKTKMCGEDPRRMYLLSLLPDINAMTDKQMRMFKRKVSDVIDDILNENPTPQNQTPTSNTSITSRAQTAFSNYSGSSLYTYNNSHNSFTPIHSPEEVTSQICNQNEHVIDDLLNMG